MDYTRILVRSSVYALAFSALTVLVCPPSVQAEIIDVHLTFDLKDSNLGGPNGGMSWSTPFISFPTVHPVAGDSLRISIRFVDHSTNQPQRLTISDLGIGDAVEDTFARADGDPSLSVETLLHNSFTFHDVRGDILSNPISVDVDAGGAGIGAHAFTNLTDAVMSFTGITWQIDFLELTYLSGDGFHLTLFAMGADHIETAQYLAVPLDIQPGACPNRLNANTHGNLPVSIQGTAAFDVTAIDPVSIRLNGVAPIRSALEDVSTPFEQPLVDASSCTDRGPDGFTDLTLKFDAQSILAAMGDVEDGEVLTVTLTGSLLDGTPIQGQDVLVILKKGKRPR